MTNGAAVSERPSSVPPAAWQLDRIVSQLREVRSRNSRDHAAERGVHELPSPDAVAKIVENLRASLFPVHFGLPELTDQSVDYYVGHTLDGALRALAEQIRRCLVLPGSRAEGSFSLDAGEVTRRFASALPEILALLETDVRAAYEGQRVTRRWAELDLMLKGQPVKRSVRVSCQPFEYQKSSLVLLMLEDLND